MINTVSYFSLDSFESVKPAAGDPSEHAPATGFAALMNLQTPGANAPIKAADPVEIDIYSTTDPEPGGNEGQTGRFSPRQSEEGTTLPQEGTEVIQEDPSVGPMVLTRGGFCYDGTPWQPIPKKEYGLDIISNRRQITNTPVNPVRLPPKEDHEIPLISGGRPIVDPTIPVRLPPVQPGSTSTPVKLPPQDGLWNDGSTRDPGGKKDFNLGVFTHIRPITDTAPPPVKLPSEEPVSPTKPEIKSTPIKTSPGSNAPIKLPPRDTLWDDGSTRDPKEMKTFNLGIFDRLRSISGGGPTVDQAVAPPVASAPANPEDASGIRADKWQEPLTGQPLTPPAGQSPVDVEPGLPAMIGEFHLPGNFEIEPGTPASLPETAPDQASESTRVVEVTETPLLVRPRPVVDPALLANLPTGKPAFTKPEIPSTHINTSYGPSSPVRLPPHEGPWDGGTTRATSKMKNFNLGIFDRKRPVTDPTAGQAADPADVVTMQTEPANPEATVAAVRANKWLEQLTGQKLPQAAFASAPVKKMSVDDVEAGPPVVPGETAGASDINIPLAVDLNPEEKPLLVRPRPIFDTVTGVDKPLLRQPFQPVETNGTATGTSEEYRANLANLFREVSSSFEPGINGNAPTGVPSTLKSVVAGTEDIIKEIGGHGTLKSVVAGTADIINEIGGYVTEVDVAPETEIKADPADPMDVQFEKLWQPEQVAPKEVKVDAGTLTLQDAKEILDQVKPGLLELAGLAAKKNEKQSMKMRLHPAELGAVEISLERNSSGALSAHFRTENEGARQALTNNLEQLRDSLQKSGWQVGQLDVSSNPSSSTADQNREHRSRQNEVVGDHLFDHRSEKPEDLEQDSSSRLLNLRA